MHRELAAARDSLVEAAWRQGFELLLVEIRSVTSQVDSTCHVLRCPSAVTKTINPGSDRRTGSLGRVR